MGDEEVFKDGETENSPTDRGPVRLQRLRGVWGRRANVLTIQTRYACRMSNLPTRDREKTDDPKVKIPSEARQQF